MSAKRALLRNPVVVGGVVIGLAAVVLLNLKTFGSSGRMLRRCVQQAENHLAPPSDLGSIVRDAVQGDADGRRLVAQASQAGWPALGRDPFSGGTQSPTAPPATKTRTKRSRRNPTRSLTCSAILLGGSRPLALIDGASYGPGDRVRDCEVTSIDTRAVRLRRTDGREIVLEVGSPASKAENYHLVTESRANQDRGQTCLAGADRAERNER